MACPVHGRIRKLCSAACEQPRREMERLGADYRQYWYDRRRGVKPMSAGEWRVRFGPWPLRRAS
jgi:hypothetical protein